MKKNSIIFAILGFIVLTSCKNESTSKQSADEKKPTEKWDEGLVLMANSCFVCHNPDTECGERVAPPMFKVREHYLDDETSKEEFIDEIVSFVQDPSEEMSYMPGAVNNFGLMPKMNFNKEDLQKIALYLYDNDVSSDEWYEKWENYQTAQKSNDTKKSVNYIEEGRKVANQTKGVLGKNLLSAIQKNGVENAIDFCSTKAIFLTDSMSKVLNTKVKRVSDKPRNVNNKASVEESTYINAFKIAKKNGGELSPKMQEKNGKVLAYYPIETNKMCLQCHGKTNKELNAKTLEKIKMIYPNDLAVGYGENEIRGLFVVEMQK